MIRTAILAGLLLVMFAMAYNRSVLPGMTADAPHAQVTPTPTPVADAAPAPPPVEPARAPAPAKAVSHRNVATVRENLLPTEPLTPKLAKAAPAAPPPAPVAEAPVTPTVAPEPPKPVPPVKAETADVAWPAPLPGAAALPSATQPAEKPASLAKAEDKPLPLATAAVTPVDDMPVREVATPRVHIPRDLPLPSEAPQSAQESHASQTVADADALDEPPPPVHQNTPAPKNTAAKADAPQFMSPQERSRELYRLAREMEDTFIAKLAH